MAFGRTQKTWLRSPMYENIIELISNKLGNFSFDFFIQ